MAKTKQILNKAETELTKVIIFLESDLKEEDRDIACEFKEDVNTLYDLLRKISEIKERKEK